jgi:tetratricopeptide (TPR) repeat protein
MLLAELYGKNKKYDMEVKVWRSIIENFKTNPVYYKKLGDAALKAGLNDSAAEAFNWYLLASPKDIGAVFMLSMVYIQTGKPQDALKKLNTLPALPGIQRLKATALGQMGKYQQALQIMKGIEVSQAGRKNQQILNKFFYSYMMYLAEKSKDVKTVLNCAEIMLKKFGDEDPHIANAVGYIYADMNIKLDEAEKLIRKSLKAKPDKVETLDSLAWVLYRKKQFAEAEKIMQRILTLQGGYTHAVIADHAGDIYAAMGRMDKAIKYWRLAIKIYSKDLNAEEVRDKIRKAEQALRGKVKNG